MNPKHLVTFALLGGAALMLPTAAAQPIDDSLGAIVEGTEEDEYSCSIALQAQQVCNFRCDPGPIHVSASASKGSVGVSGSCGGGSASCQTAKVDTCSDSAEADQSGKGTCEITDASLLNDEGSASCSGTRREEEGGGSEPADCYIEVDSICLIEERFLPAEVDVPCYENLLAPQVQWDYGSLVDRLRNSSECGA